MHVTLRGKFQAALLTLQSLFSLSLPHTENLHVPIHMGCMLYHRMPSTDEIPPTYAISTFIKMISIIQSTRICTNISQALWLSNKLCKKRTCKHQSNLLTLCIKLLHQSLVTHLCAASCQDCSDQCTINDNIWKIYHVIMNAVCMHLKVLALSII